MPITSQHIPMPYDEWDLLPYQPGWKMEYWDGCSHLTPNHQTAVTVVDVASRPVQGAWLLRPVRVADEAPLLPIYLDAFADNQAFCDYTDEQFHEAARKDLHDGFRGRRSPLLSASRVAVDGSGDREVLLGAALLSRDERHGTVLDLIFVRTDCQQQGLATALVWAAMNVLAQEGEARLTSCYQLANETSQAWHRVFGFVELPDLSYARAYYRRARQELHRYDTPGVNTDRDRATLVAEVKSWKNQIEALERLSREQGFEAVHPRRPHW